VFEGDAAMYGMLHIPGIANVFSNHATCSKIPIDVDTPRTRAPLLALGFIPSSDHNSPDLILRIYTHRGM
jgi:hypothetical protein